MPLYLCGTPIGHLKDLTFRVLEALKASDYILAEDTRVTQKLLHTYQIQKPLISVHLHNETKKTPQIIALLREGKHMALVSSAGLPLISDPGMYLVQHVIEENLPLTVLPSGTAFLVALLLSGCDTRRFVFEGFLPRTNKNRRRHLRKLQEEERTLIFYETPHRLLDTLKDMEEIWGDRYISVSREMTKQFEETKRGSIQEVRAYFSVRVPLGEFTIVVGERRTNTSSKRSNKA